jgi:hypothetical protein
MEKMYFRAASCALVLMATAFAACGSNDDDEDNKEVVVETVDVTASLLKTEGATAWQVVKESGWTMAGGKKQTFATGDAANNTCYFFNADYTGMSVAPDGTTSPYCWAVTSSQVVMTNIAGADTKLSGSLNTNLDTLTLTLQTTDSYDVKTCVQRKMNTFAETLLTNTAGGTSDYGPWIMSHETGWTNNGVSKTLFDNAGSTFRYLFYSDHTGYSADNTDVKSHFTWRLTNNTLALTYTGGEKNSLYIVNLSAKAFATTTYASGRYGCQYFTRSE